MRRCGQSANGHIEHAELLIDSDWDRRLTIAQADELVAVILDALNELDRWQALAGS
jgi:hypothetical protein